MSFFRIRFELLGAHVHCRLFVASSLNQAFATCGTFVVNQGEEFRSLLSSFSGAQFIGTDESGIINACEDK